MINNDDIMNFFNCYHAYGLVNADTSNEVTVTMTIDMRDFEALVKNAMKVRVIDSRFNKDNIDAFLYTLSDFGTEDIILPESAGNNPENNELTFSDIVGF